MPVSHSILILASSFYTAALERPIVQALAKRGDSRTLVCVPYNQHHTLLLEPRSFIPEGVPATAVFLMREEDLIRRELVEGVTVNPTNPANWVTVFRDRTSQFLDILRRLSGIQLTLLICPSGRGAYDVTFLGDYLRIAELRTAAELRMQQRHEVLTWSDFEGCASTSSLFNPAGDRLGHVPFSPEGLDDLAAFLVERMDTLPLTVLESKSPFASGTNVAYREFLGKLAVEISVARLSPNDDEHIIDLARHTTHFINAPLHKLTIEELRALAEGEGQVFTVGVRDRFGDYGTSGVMALNTSHGTLNIDFWFLSCPVLGKQVEFAVMAWVAELAQQKHMDFIEIPFVQGPDNLVLRRFLSTIDRSGVDQDVTSQLGAARVFRVTVSGLRELCLQCAPNPTAVRKIFSNMRAMESLSGVAA